MKKRANVYARRRRYITGLGGGFAIMVLMGCSTAQSPNLSSECDASFYLSAQDGRAGLVDGNPVVRHAPDSLAVVKLDAGHLSIVQAINVPASLIGPPNSIAITPDGRLALVSASTRSDPVDQQKVVPYDLVSVIALDRNSATPLKLIGSLHTGLGAAGIAIDKTGGIALVANRAEGSVSLLSIHGSDVKATDKLLLGPQSLPGNVAFIDEHHAMVTRDGDNRISLLDVDASSVRLGGKTLHAGLRPSGLDISSDAKWAVLSNLGGGEGDADTI
ncbi:YncE family protein [Paraburkholderia tropica]|uniref:YncE family protein n=1 Tax=Paraburkholderia tropica TaxID=92647 RepID=UPI002AB04CDD|nr:hypothetical protein [Paraburkholderia tropica]